jgi:hypothetical protein
METAKLLEILAYTLPSLVTGSIAVYLFKAYFKDQQNTRRWLLHKETKKEILPIRLQAYERMTLFMERVSLTNLLIRLAPFSEDKNQYENYLISEIEKEFEHNLPQQIYVSPECWTIIMTAKNVTIQTIRKTNMSERVKDADKLREVLLSDSVENQSSSIAALSFIKQEVSSLW